MERSFSRKVGCFLAFAALFFAFAAPVESYGASSFKDTKGHWAEQYIETAVGQGIIKGYTDGRFKPDAKVSRAEFISMLNRALGNISTGTVNFDDVSGNAWYYYDVAKAVTAGYVDGFSDGTFRPGDFITRQEAAVMLSRLLPTYGYDRSLSRYSDYRSIADWATTAMSKMSGKSYISGYTDGKIHPLDSLTRAQAAKIISDIVDKENIVASDPTVKKDGTTLTGKIYSNNVTIHKDLDDGEVTIENCVILGKLIVQGGGENSVTVNNSRIANALVDRSAGRVRLLAKGETAILNTVCSEDFALETYRLSGTDFGPGFQKVSLSSSSSGTFTGSFPHVSVDGSSAELQLLSGTISTLDVTSSGRRSNIIMDNKTVVTQANVHAESYFHGTGIVSDMQVHAKGITYETKPKKWNIRSGGGTPELNDPELTVAFTPTKGKTKVYLDTKITVTFSSAMREDDGSTITNSELPGIVTIRKGSATGSTVAYSGTINSAKTVMTLTPTSPLLEDTRYYIVVKAGTMIDADGEDNEAVTSYFNTGSSTEKLAVTYSPVNGDASVPADRKSFTINLSEGVTRYNGTSLSTSDSYLKSNVVLFRRGNTAVSTSDYSVSINSSRSRITITLDDDYALSLNTKYTIGILASTLKTADGDAVAASSATWTTAGMPVLSSVSVVPRETSVDFKATPNISGRIYAVLLPADAVAPTAARIRDGKDATDAAAIAAVNAATPASGAATLTLSGEGITRDTAYRIYAVMYDGSGNASHVVSSAATTEPLKLKSLTIVPDTGTANILSGFKPDKLSYGTIVVPDGTSYVEVTAEANALSFVGDLTINGDVEMAGKQIDLTAGSADISVVVQELGKRSVTYTVTVRVAGSAALDSMTINGTDYVPDVSAPFAIGADPVQVTLAITPTDLAATIQIDGVTITAGDPITLNLDSTITQKNFVIASADGLATKAYTIQFDRTPFPEDPLDI
ncbi:MAG TPA: hypothetical protein DF480_03060 [Clostridiales bacterium]|nr:hypothetical protein [Clostridiales bacterium]